MVQLGRANTLQSGRQRAAKRYLKRLTGLPLDCPTPAPSDSLHSWHLFPIRVHEDAPLTRDDIIASAASDDVIAGTAAEETLKKMRIKSRTFATAMEGIAAVRHGKLDAFVFDRALLAWTVQQGGSSGIQLLDTTFDPQNYALVLPNGSPLRKSATVAQLGVMQSDWWQEASFRYLGSK